MNTHDIPQDWIKKYVDTLIEIAKELTEGSAMQIEVTKRAMNAMELVEAFRESEFKSQINLPPQTG